MVEGAGRHTELVAELAEWWEDLGQTHTGSRVVLVEVPHHGAGPLEFIALLANPGRLIDQLFLAC
jgi:hypothetical protein